MEELLAFINSLPADERDAWCIRCGTTQGYLRKACSKKQNLGEGICIRIEKESAAAVRCEMLRPDVDWAYLRGSLSITAVSQTECAPIAIESIAPIAAAIEKLEVAAEDQVAQVALDARVEIAKLAALAENQINAAARAPREVWSHERREAERLSRLAAGAVGTPVELSAKEA